MKKDQIHVELQNQSRQSEASERDQQSIADFDNHEIPL